MKGHAMSIIELLGPPKRIAKIAGVGVNTVYNWTSGKTSPQSRHVYALSHSFRVYPSVFTPGPICSTDPVPIDDHPNWPTAARISRWVGLRIQESIVRGCEDMEESILSFSDYRLAQTLGMANHTVKNIKEAGEGRWDLVLRVIKDGLGVDPRLLLHGKVKPAPPATSLRTRSSRVYPK